MLSLIAVASLALAGPACTGVVVVLSGLVVALCAASFGWTCVALAFMLAGEL